MSNARPTAPFVRSSRSRRRPLPLQRIFAAAIVVMIGVFGRPAVGQSPATESQDQSAAGAPPPENEASNEDAPFGNLLEGLEGVGDAEMQPAGGEPSASETTPPRQSAPDRREQPATPLRVAQRAMGEAARLLRENGRSERAGTAQQQALDALDALIQQSLAASGQSTASQQESASSQAAEERPQQPKPAGGEEATANEQGDAEQERGEPASGVPGSRPGDQPGQAPEQEVDAVAGPLSEPMDNAVWGHLPARLRERLHATLPEEFLPAYEQTIRDYFLRLSEMSDADGR